MNLTMGSLFDGIGGFPLAAERDQNTLGQRDRAVPHESHGAALPRHGP